MVLSQEEGRGDLPAGVPGGAALVVLTAAGCDLARRMKPALPDSRIHGLSRRVEDCDERFNDVAVHIRRLFAEGRPIVGICAAGILIRALAPLIEDKRSEPPVLAVSEDGATIVPLLGGHRGAVALARALAQWCGGSAAITTAGEARFGVALDDPPAGWRIANPEMIKPISAAFLAAEPVALLCEAGDGGWLSECAVDFSEGAELAIRVSHRAAAAADNELVFHPPVLALGVGGARGVDGGELAALAGKALATRGLSAKAVACVCSIDLKSDEAAVHALAESLDVAARFFAAETLEAETPRLETPSLAVYRETGCHGVSEGAALAAVGKTGMLVVPKVKSKQATCAVALALQPLDASSIGRRRGELAVIGIGPGAEDWLTPEAKSLLVHATDAVGYGLYLDLVADLIEEAVRHAFTFGEEEARVRTALDLAAEGRRVVLVSSGDAGIYGMGSLVFELLEREDRAAWNRLSLTVVPGISALQAAASRVGAPLGHDFCAISLSDLLTPWEEILKRLRAAAAGDFVVALYNPVSKRRRHQLAEARDILLAARPPATPVVLARNLGRADERVETITLGELRPDHADMLTLVLVGNRRTRAVRRGGEIRVYTPRGYAEKARGAAPKRRNVR